MAIAQKSLRPAKPLYERPKGDPMSFVNPDKHFRPIRTREPERLVPIPDERRDDFWIAAADEVPPVTRAGVRSKAKLLGMGFVIGTVATLGALLYVASAIKPTLNEKSGEGGTGGGPLRAVATLPVGGAPVTEGGTEPRAPTGNPTPPQPRTAPSPTPSVPPTRAPIPAPKSQPPSTWPGLWKAPTAHTRTAAQQRRQTAASRPAGSSACRDPQRKAFPAAADLFGPGPGVRGLLK